MNKLFVSVVSLGCLSILLYPHKQVEASEHSIQLIAQTPQAQQADLAESLIQQMIDEYSQDPEVLSELAKFLAENGEQERAWTLFEAAWNSTASAPSYS